MANDVNYKTKYQELKLKFINSIDTSWRLGYEAGMQASQIQNAQQQAQLQSQAQVQAQSKPESKPEQPKTEESKEMDASQHPDGSELDQHIAELEEMLGKSEITPDDLKKVLESMKLKKNEVKSIHIPSLNIGIPNMDNGSKEALKIQSTIVDRVMKNWDDEEQRMSKHITNILSSEGVVAKE